MCLYDTVTWAKPRAAQENGKSSAKVCIEGIYNGVERRVCPSKPHEDVKGGGTDTWKVTLAKWHHAVKDKEGQPATHKHSHYNRQGL